MCVCVGVVSDFTYSYISLCVDMYPEMFCEYIYICIYMYFFFSICVCVCVCVCVQIHVFSTLV